MFKKKHAIDNTPYWGAIYSFNSYMSKMFFRRIEILLLYFLNRKRKNESIILDIGSGNGELIDRLIKSNIKIKFIVSLDLDKNCLNSQRKRFKSSDIPVYYVVANAEALPFYKKTFSDVFAISIFDHLKVFQSCVDSINYILRDGGLLYCGYHYDTWVYRITHFIITSYVCLIKKGEGLRNWYTHLNEHIHKSSTISKYTENILHLKKYEKIKLLFSTVYIGMCFKKSKRNIKVRNYSD